MNTPNPLISKGSLGEQKPRSKSQFYLWFFVIALVHVVAISGLLITGCTRKEDKDKDSSVTSNSPTNDTSSPFAKLDETNPNAKPLGLQPTNDTAAANANPPGVTTGPGTTVTTGTNTPVPPPGGGNDLSRATIPTTNPGAVTHVEDAGGARQHKVEKGDSFYTLSKKYNTTISAIQKANPGVDSAHLKIGQPLNIPASSAPAAAADTGAHTTSAAPGSGTVYTVKSGDTLSTIAKKHHVTVNEIRKANNLKTDRISTNQKLKIPTRGAAAPVETTQPVTPDASRSVPPPPPVQ